MSAPNIREPQKIPIELGRRRTKCGVILVFVTSDLPSARAGAICGEPWLRGRR